MNKSVGRLREVIKSVTMQSVSMHDLEQFSYWQVKRLSSYHCYDVYNLVISVDLTELADRVVGNNDSVEEIQLDLRIQQLRVPAWNESLLMSMSDALLRSLLRWITDHGYPMRSPVTSASRTVTFTINKMSRGVNQHSSLCFLSMDCFVITIIFSHVGLVKL